MGSRAAAGRNAHEHTRIALSLLKAGLREDRKRRSRKPDQQSPCGFDNVRPGAARSAPARIGGVERLVPGSTPALDGQRGFDAPEVKHGQMLFISVSAKERQ